MTPVTMLTIIIIAAAGLLFVAALLVGLCRAAADTRPVDEGQSFGGEYHD